MNYERQYTEKISDINLSIGASSEQFIQDLHKSEYKTQFTVSITRA